MHGIGACGPWVAELVVLIAVAGLFVSRVAVVPAALPKRRRSGVWPSAWAGLRLLRCLSVSSSPSRLHHHRRACRAVPVGGAACLYPSVVTLFRERPWIGHETTITRSVRGPRARDRRSGRRQSVLARYHPRSISGCFVSARHCSARRALLAAAGAGAVTESIFGFVGGVLAEFFAPAARTASVQQHLRIPLLIAAAHPRAPGRSQAKDGRDSCVKPCRCSHARRWSPRRGLVRTADARIREPPFRSARRTRWVMLDLSPTAGAAIFVSCSPSW